MKILSFKKVVPVLMVALAFAACKKSPYPGYEKSESGFYYQFFLENKGSKPSVGDVITLKMTYKNSKDSILFNSNNMKNNTGTIEFPLSASTFKGSFEDAVLTMSVGDSASFIINADSVYLKTFRAPELPAYIEKGSILTFNIKLEKIKSKEEAMKEQQKRMDEQKVIMDLRKNEEPKVIAKYLAENKINVKPTSDGLYYIEKVKGKGKKISVGDTVQVHYKGMLLDGTVFDSSERNPNPVEFPIGVGAVIKGWDEGIPMMNVGGKALLLIPSAIAYGETGAQGVIPPYSPLLFEVEVVGIK